LKVFLSKVFEFIRQSQIILGCGGALLASQTYKLLYIESLPLKITLFLFFAITSAYTFLGIKISTYEQRLSVEIKKSSLLKVVITWLSISATLFLFFMQEKKVQAVAVLLLIFTLAYMTPFYFNKRKIKGVRDVFILKSSWLAFVWSVATVIVPVVHFKGFDFGKTELTFFVQRFLFITAIALAFNIRDYNYDLQKQMKTIATVAGVYKTKIIAIAILSLSFLLAVLFNTGNLLIAIAIAIAIVYTITLVIFAKPAAKNFFYVVLMDGALLVHGLLLVLLG
jgi:4-hydroxybenzoate polyprenyltransferase